jgi:hypothetical protein
MPEMRLFGTARTLDFDLATGLNFSLYVERPPLEHLYNVKRTWLTISQLQSESRYLTPIPYLQWFGEGELKRQVRLLREASTPSPSTFKRCEKSGCGSGYCVGWRR